LYSLSDLAEISGAKRRTVQLWAEGGALRAEPGSDRMGRGTHREFQQIEAVIAAILARLAPWNISIGKLRRIAEGFRSAMEKEAEVRDLIWGCVKGTRTARMAIFADGGVSLIGGEDEDKLALALRRLNPSNETVLVVYLNEALSKLRFR
jgi:hypothetical protein